MGLTIGATYVTFGTHIYVVIFNFAQAVRQSTIGRRAFPIAGARVWNNLLSDVTSAPSLAVFGRRLKTELFRRCYNVA